MHLFSTQWQTKSATKIVKTTVIFIIKIVFQPKKKKYAKVVVPLVLFISYISMGNVIFGFVEFWLKWIGIEGSFIWYSRIVSTHINNNNI